MNKPFEKDRYGNIGRVKGKEVYYSKKAVEKVIDDWWKDITDKRIGNFHKFYTLDIADVQKLKQKLSEVVVE